MQAAPPCTLAATYWSCPWRSRLPTATWCSAETRDSTERRRAPETQRRRQTSSASDRQCTMLHSTSHYSDYIILHCMIDGECEKHETTANVISVLQAMYHAAQHITNSKHRHRLLVISRDASTWQMEQGFMSRSTQNRSLWRQSSQPNSWAQYWKY